MTSDIFLNNFGTKISSGTVTILCELLADGTNYRDALASSSWFYDSAVAETIDPSELDGLTFTKNYVGRKGSALYIKGMSVSLLNSVFTENGAVNAIRE